MVIKNSIMFFLLLKTGIESADFVFYISAMETERCQKGMTVAYAAHCQQESALDRLVVTLQKVNVIDSFLDNENMKMNR